MIEIRTEEDRKREMLNFINRQIDELKRNIWGCDYIEDVNGQLQYLPGSYIDEKREYEHNLRQWEILKEMLTSDMPVLMFDW